MLAENKCNEVTRLLNCESIINNKLLHQMTKIMKHPTLRIDLSVITRSTSGWVESSHTNSNTREKKLHWLNGRPTKTAWEAQAITEMDMFSVNILGHTLFLHWHPLALPQLLMAIPSHTNCPQKIVWTLGLLCCCCFCQDCRCWSRHVHLARVLTDMGLSTGGSLLALFAHLLKCCHPCLVLVSLLNCCKTFHYVLNG